MKWMTRISGIILALCLFVILLVSAFDYCIYYRTDFYKDTFEKYGVPSYANMELPEVLRVSNYLIDYLKGKEETLTTFRAVVNGEERPFYSEREILHMKDVKTLFTFGIWSRRIGIGLAVIILAVLWLVYRLSGQKTPSDNSGFRPPGTRTGLFIRRTLVRCIIGTFFALAAAAGLLGAVIASNFNQAFTTFHHLFFSNDLWLLNPNKDWLIRLLPEEFFLDMAASVFVVFLVSILVVLFLCTLYLIAIRRCASDLSTADAQQQDF